MAERAGVAKQYVTRIEIGATDPRLSTMTALNEAVRSAGVEMAEDVNGAVRLTVSRDKLLATRALMGAPMTAQNRARKLGNCHIRWLD